MQLSPSVGPNAENVIEDTHLLARYGQGDEFAFALLINKYRPRIFSVALRFLHNVQDAEEVTQDSFIHAHRGLKNYRGESSFSTWLHQIALNLARSKYWYWKRRQRGNILSLDGPSGDAASTALLDTMADGQRGASEMASESEFLTAVASGLQKIRPIHRDILHLRVSRHCSYSEISEQLGIPVCTVKSRISRARKILKREVEEILEPETAGQRSRRLISPGRILL